MPEETNGASPHPNPPVDQASADNSSAPLSVSNLQQHDAAHTDTSNASQKSYRHHRQASQSQTHPNKAQSQYNRKNYGQKGNHQHQFNNYSAAQAAQVQAQAAQAYNNMYYGYYQPNYGYMMPVNPFQSAQSPGMVSPTPFNGIPGSPGLPVMSPPPHYSGKVKITDKEGKQIDLEEKKKLHTSTASATPISSPKQTNASPVKPAAPVVKPAAPVVKPAVSTTKAGQDGGVLEDFKEKVKRLAAAAKAKKEAEAKAKLEAQSGSKPPAEETSKQDAAPVAEAAKSEPAQPKAETPLKEEEKSEPTKSDTSTLEEPQLKQEVAQPVAAEPVTEQKAQPEIPEPEVEAAKPETKVETPEPETKVETTEPVTEVETTEPVTIAEVTKLEAAPSETAQSSIPESAPASEPASEPKTVDVVSNEVVKENTPEADVPEIKENTGEDEDSGVEEDEEEGDAEGEEDAAPEEEESAMNLTQFFAKLKDAEPIADPYSIQYPEPFVSVDPKWKLEKKKYRYDPQFLIQFRDVVQLDVDEEWNNKLLGLGIVATQRENKKYGSGMQRGGSNRFGNAMPGRFNSMSGRGGQYPDGRQNSRNGSKRRGGGGGSTRDKSKRNNQSRRKGESEPTIAPEDIKPLEKSANRWVPKSRVKKDEVKYAPDGVTPILDEEEVERKVQSLLNKLTLEMFETITDSILEICEQSKWEDDAKTVKQIISLTFAKACDEPYWSSMYAQFCAKMCTQLSDDIAVEDFNGQGRKYGGDLARRLLLATCQKEYEKGWTDKLPQNEDGTPLEMMSEEYYTMAAAKRRGLGLVKFIGQLYLLNMLNDRVVILCLTSSSKNTVDPSEDSLESLAQLITAIGPKFEQSDKNKTIMQSIFDSIAKILANVKLSSRIRFMLMDLQDTRRNGWVSAKQETGPKTIKEIHDDAEIKRLEDEKAAIERRRKNKNNDSRSNSTRGGSNWGSQPKRVESSSRITPLKDSKGFTAVQRSQSNRINDNSYTLSPRENSKRTDSVQSSANMFAALDGDDNDNDDEHVNENAT